MKILITSGATRESIDEIRFITNFSTGITGCLMAETFVDLEATVTYIHGKNSRIPDRKVDLIQFSDFYSLDEILQKTLAKQKFDLIIHLTAVSDYSVDYLLIDNKKFSNKDIKKIDSESNIAIFLKKNFKIVSKLREYCGNLGIDTIIVPFKLTNTTNQEERMSAVAKVFNHQGINYVVHNDFGEITDGTRNFCIYDKNLNEFKRCNSPQDLSKILYQISLKEKVGNK